MLAPKLSLQIRARRTRRDPDPIILGGDYFRFRAPAPVVVSHSYA